MSLFFILYLLLIITSIRRNSDNKVEKFLSPNRTAAINGVFVLMVFFSHFYSYYANVNLSLFDLAPRKVVFTIGQLMVAPFLFFSGYGIMYSIKNKKNYIDTFLRKRFVPTWVNFAIAICCFVIVDAVLGISYPHINYLLAFTGYESIGNSNWYMLAVFVLYIFTIFSFRLSRKNHTKGIIIIVLLCVLYIALMELAKDGGYWCNTILCYPFGMFVYHKKELIERAFSDKKRQIISVIVAAFITIAFNFILNKMYTDVVYLAMAIGFCSVLLGLSKWFFLESKILVFLGKNVFWIYILQRIPMMIFSKNIEIHICFILCLMIIIVGATVFKKYSDKLYKRICDNDVKIKNSSRCKQQGKNA